MHVDVAVIGGGPAGLAAALTAKEEGADVALFERHPYLGGLGRLGMGIAAVESRLQRERAFPFKKDDAFKLVMEHTDWKADARLVRAWIEDMPRVIAWLESMGVEFELLEVYQSPEFVTPTGHLVKRAREVVLGAEEGKWVGVAGEVRISPREPLPFEGGRTAVMVQIMVEKAKEMGVRLMTGVRAKRILMDRGRAVGVVIEMRGREEEVTCSAVVIATGGFCHNGELVKRYTGLEVGKEIFPLHTVELLGDGHRMAWEVGAAEDTMAPAILTEPLLPYDPTLRSAFNQPFNLVVNKNGNRFISEEKLGANWVHLAYAMLKQKGKCAYVILDDNVLQHMEEEGLEYIYYLFRPPKTRISRSEFDEALKRATARGGFLVVASDVEELAVRVGVKPKALKETIEEYNRYCESGRDLQFMKKPRYLIPLRGPKYYATKYVLYMYTTVGGIRINERAEVLNREGDPIPGLYAAGDCAASILAYDYSLTYMLWGANLSFALFTGRLAGRNAARYAKGLQQVKEH